MKALGYFTAHQLSSFAIEELEVQEPVINDHDLLVRVKAVSVNPVDYKIRQSRHAEGKRPVILGWDVSGIVEKTGSLVKGFKIGDEVYYAGDLKRDGGNAQLHAVDHRIAAKKPSNLDFAHAAALPLTSLTAYEALFPRAISSMEANDKVLIIGGAGGVGSIAIQILKAMTNTMVLATASRPDTVAWCKRMGADLVLDHTRNLHQQLDQHQIKNVDVIFGTTHSAQYLEIIPQLLRPFGHFCLIDDPRILDIAGFKTKALSVHWEYMFAKTLYGFDIASQGQILQTIAQLVEKGKIISTANMILKGFSAENLRKAHEMLESGKSSGKIVIEFD
jgi:zinc-binding alcohol dehydrogenase family protein